MVRYVRREIRSLTDFDRESFFQAVMIMQVCVEAPDSFTCRHAQL